MATTTAPPKAPPTGSKPTKPLAPPAQQAPPPVTNVHPTSGATFGKLTPNGAGFRIVLNAVEGWGKTSAPAFALNPAIIMCQGETGYETLLSAGRVPSVDAAGAGTWADLLALVSNAEKIATPYGVLAIDAAGGAERLCHEMVCARDFKNDWGERGFSSYQKGYEVALTDWLDLLARLDKVCQRGTHILIISHAKIKTSKNPLGADFDRYVADCHEKTWGLTHKWADAVLFGTFITIVDKQKGDSKSKGIGGTDRIIYTEHRDAFDAKNRFGMPSEIEIPNDPKAVWSTIFQHINKKGQ